MLVSKTTRQVLTSHSKAQKRQPVQIITQIHCLRLMGATRRELAMGHRAVADAILISIQRQWLEQKVSKWIFTRKMKGWISNNGLISNLKKSSRKALQIYVPANKVHSTITKTTKNQQVLEIFREMYSHFKDPATRTTTSLRAFPKVYRATWVDLETKPIVLVPKTIRLWVQTIMRIAVLASHHLENRTKTQVSFQFLF